MSYLQHLPHSIFKSSLANYVRFINQNLFYKNLQCKGKFLTSIQFNSLLNCAVQKRYYSISYTNENDNISQTNRSDSINNKDPEVNNDAEVSNTSFSDIPGVESSGAKMVLVYTCKICETRSLKKISKHSYEKGVVVVRCASCKSLHLIADNMGIFEDPGWNIEKHLAETGENSLFVNEDNVFELKLDDIIGKNSKNKDL
eukprot:gene6966-9522_t